MAQEGITIQSKLLDKKNDIYLVELGGYVDQANVHLLQKEIDEHIHTGSYKLIFDLQNLIYMSSAGWGVLIGEIKRFRENGGDIKLINMRPEVYEIYQMLEFYHIISEYPSIEEALKSFNVGAEAWIQREQVMKELAEEVTPENENLDIQKLLNTADDSPEQVVLDGEIEVEISNILEETTESNRAKPNEMGHVEFVPPQSTRKIDIKLLPITEKIKHIVSKNPTLGPRKIRKKLRTEEYGGVKIGYFKIRSLLKMLELDTREKRYRYYRSC